MGISMTGIYQLIPEANDNFDIYSTGGGAFTQLFFSGSGYWLGSGYTINNNYLFYETFDFYQTGQISGYNGTSLIYPALNSGTTQSGYYLFTGIYSGYTVWSGYLP